jgi:hypothetical protein
VYKIPAISREILPEIQANVIKLCSMQHLQTSFKRADLIQYCTTSLNLFLY